MATNTSALKTFAQQTRAKLISLITTKMQFVLNGDTAELRGYEREIGELRKQIAEKTEKIVIEEVAYTWFNRVMALRFMDANGYNAPMAVTPAEGQTRPEILQDAMGGSIDDALMLTAEEKVLPEAKLYRKLLVAVCNKQMSQPMPFLFEHISDYTELLLPDDLLSDQSFVTDIRHGMTDEDCQNVELMGWLYQFYITDRKADAEIKKSKKGGLKSDEQAAATQLFTPHWIVRYMVENSLGRIWMTLHPESSLIKEMPYYIATSDGQTDTIPEDIHSARDIRFIDPCMGSGHILVYAFDLLTKMYEEEGEQTKDIPTLILENNLYGIDIDRRCYQLASFALTMKARAYYRRYLRHTVNPNVISLEKIDHDTIDSAGAWGQKSLMWQFENIDTIGSLLKVTSEECAAIKVGDGIFRERQRLLKTQAEYLSRKYHCVVTNPPYLGKGFCEELKKYLVNNYPDSKDDTMTAFIERCMDFSTPSGKLAMIILPAWVSNGTYDKLRYKIITNNHIDSLLHMGRGIFGIDWGSTAFTFCKEKKSTKSIFFRLHKRNFQHLYAEHIGQLFIQVKKNHELRYDFDTYRDVDVTDLSSYHFENSDKGVKMYYECDQNNFVKIPGYLIGYWLTEKLLNNWDNNNSKLSQKLITREGMATAGNPIFLRNWFEVSYKKCDYRNTEDKKTSTKKWFPYNKGGVFRKWYGNNEFIVNYENDGYEIKHNIDPSTGRVRSHNYNGEFAYKEGITWSSISSGSISIRYSKPGFLWDSKGAMGFIRSKSNLYYIMCLINSSVAQSYLKVLAPSMDFKVGDIIQLPYLEDENLSDTIIKLTKQNILISETDWDSHETSWDFKTNELLRLALGLSPDQVESSAMSDVCRSVSIESIVSQYKTYWRDQFMQLHNNEEELNREFIEIYGLQDELTPDVPLDEVTILQKGEMDIVDNQIEWHEEVVIKQLISYLIGCFMGRYSVNKPGLVIASQGQKVSDLDLPVQTLEIDDDGIIPIIQEEDFFADDMTQRIEAAVKTLFGEEHFYENMKYIKSVLGQNLRDYLYKNYYADHQQMYSVKGAKRPIYWLFSSQMGDKKRKGYFKALVYMHRLEADTLSKLHADYVHPYIQKIEQQLLEAEDNAMRDDLSQTQHNKAIKLAEDLRDKVREVKAFETQLVEMASVRITIDLDDGVKANYPKFYPLVEPIKGLDAKDED